MLETIISNWYWSFFFPKCGFLKKRDISTFELSQTAPKAKTMHLTGRWLYSLIPHGLKSFVPSKRALLPVQSDLESNVVWLA